MRKARWFLAVILLGLVASACNLESAAEVTTTLQGSQTGTRTVTRTGTVTSTLRIPTLLPLPTSRGTVISGLPTAVFPATIRPFGTVIPPIQATPPSPTRITILSPGPGSIISGNFQVTGAALHPRFLQYQLEYGPDPNPANLWYPADSVKFTPVLDNVLGFWNTTAVPDGAYLLRLRVFLRDGTTLSTVSNNIRVRNSAPTPVPSATPSTPRPIAAFSADRYSGEVPLTVRFFNQSSGNISGVTWNFGDGNTSTQANPTYTYTRAGLYTVTLSVTGPGGTSNVSSQINVRTTTAPIAGFSQSVASGRAPLTVQFTDQSTGNVTSWLWNFSDGTVSTERNPSHVFTTVGTYNVFLTVTGPGGTSIARRQLVVENPVTPPPSALFGYNPPSGVAPLTVQFTNQSTGNITLYSWNFGDGTLSDQTNPTHTFPFPGTYTVTLIASGPGGYSSTQANVIVIAPTATFTPTATATTIPPTATFTSIPPTATFTETPVLPTVTGIPPTATLTETPIPPTFTPTVTPIPPTFTGVPPTPTATTIPPTATFTEAPIPPTATFTGVPPTATFTETPVPPTATFTETPIPPTQTETPVPPTATFTETPIPPTFTPTETPIPPTATFTETPVPPTATFTETPIPPTFMPTDTPIPPTATFTETPVPPTATFTETPVPPTPTETPVPPVALFTAAVTGDPMTYQFLNQSTGAIATLQWNFGDGTTSAEANPVHTYGAAGDYNVTLTATAADGVTSDTETLTITVVAPTPTPEPVDAVFTFDPNTGVPLTVAFVNQSTGPIGSYTWDFGDGTTSGEVNPVHTFPGGGDFNVTLTVTSSADGTTDGAVNLVTVVAPTPTAEPVTADFVTSPVDGQPLTVQFTSSAGGPVGSYFWDFGDGTTGTEVHPTHTYPGGGDYTATLTVTSSVDGTTNSFSQGVSVTAPTPTATTEPVVAAFTFAPVAGMPLTVQFTNQSTGPVAISTWDFNDGTTSNETSPIHTFPFAGDFTVTLNVTAADNITSNSISQVVSVIAPTPTTEPVTASFTFAPVAGTPLTIQFTNQSAGPVASYTWDFNDGTTSNEANPVHTFAAAADYSVTLTVTANDGVTTNSSAQIVSVIAPTPTTEPVDALFSAAPVAGTPLTVEFTNQSTGLVVTSTWDFGDGTSSNETNPIHTFPGVGDYTVTLTVTAADDVTTDSEAQTVTVEAAPQAAPEPLLSLNAFIGEVNDAVWNPNNTRIAAANEDGTISLWDVSTGQVANTLTGHATEVIALAWNPNGSHLASGGIDGLMLIWDLNNLQPVVTQQATDSVTAMAWSADGARLAVGSADGTITLYDTVGTATPLTPANDDAVNALAWGASDTRLLIGVDDGSIILLDLTNGLPVYTLQADDDVTSVAWSPNSQQFATGIADGTVIVWDTASGQPALPTLAEHNDAVTVVAWSPLGTQILSGSADGDIILWDATTGTTVQTFSGHTDAVTSVEWNSDGSQFLSASDDGTVLIWQP